MTARGSPQDVGDGVGVASECVGEAALRVPHEHELVLTTRGEQRPRGVPRDRVDLVAVATEGAQRRGTVDTTQLHRAVNRRR